MTPSISIFIRTYRGDREWLNFCLRSLKKYATGFHEVVVVIPKGDEPHFDLFDFHGAKVVWYDDLPIDGYNAQQECKVHADQMCEGQLICFIDSDCFITAPLTPGMFCNERGKPIQLLRHWAEVGDAKCWLPITAAALGETPIFEHMACQGSIYDRTTFSVLRTHMEATHKMTIREYISRVKGREFSEFNLLGAFALRYLPHFYDWRIADPSTDGYPRTIRQQWSWQPGGVDRHRAEYEELLAR